MIRWDLCDWCRIKRAKKKAKKQGWKVTRLKTRPGGPQGVTVYCHPQEVNIKKLKGLARGEYYVSFYETKPESCCCGKG